MFNHSMFVAAAEEAPQTANIAASNVLRFLSLFITPHSCFTRCSLRAQLLASCESPTVDPRRTALPSTR